MARKKVCRIYTEQKNKRAIVQLAAEKFESFTVQPTAGYYKGREEKSIVIEIVGARATHIKSLAERIRKMNRQKSVLSLRFEAQAEVNRA
jgi:uncharacterized membrane-anchored protein YitT (DUF2179 family)